MLTAPVSAYIFIVSRAAIARIDDNFRAVQGLIKLFKLIHKLNIEQRIMASSAFALELADIEMLDKLSFIR